MQFTAVWIKKYLLDATMSLNDICCYIPAWFGVITTFITGMIAYECTIPANTTSNIAQFLYQLFMLITTGTRIPENPVLASTSTKTFLGLSSPATECALAAMAMMSIVPAHLMRSMGGGYDNESVAVSAMVLTYYCWVRSLRTHDSTSYLYGIATGLAYFYMVASWGGYVFVLNLIGVHAAVLVLMGRFETTTVYRAYTLFYIVGTSLAVHIPVVGYAPIKSIEQLGPCAVFLGYQLLYITETIIAQKKNTWTRKDSYIFRAQVMLGAAAIAVIATMMIAPTGYFGPISSRVRGLFVKHTKTGNPLVDSVAEHQPANSMAYFQFLHHVCSLAPVGFFIILFRLSNSSSFLLVWSVTAYFFSHKMVRLILLTAPIGSVLGGIAVGRLVVWCIHQWWNSSDTTTDASSTNAAIITPIMAGTTSSDDLTAFDSTDGLKALKGGLKGVGKKSKKGGTTIGQTNTSKRASSKGDGSSFDGLIALQDSVLQFSKSREGWIIRRVVSLIMIIAIYIATQSFVNYCWRLQHDLSSPTIIVKARRRDGTVIKVDDYREAYWWLRDNTPEDSRVMAWWDCKFIVQYVFVTE
jgi:dolichyl-diphosphooligosaccharide---protein glycosyltransferase